MLLFEKKIDNLQVYVYENRRYMGKEAAKKAAEIINSAIARKGEANVIFAAAPSQTDLLEALISENVDWTKVNAFQQDEYLGLDPEHPAGFGNFLRRHIYDKLPFKSCHFLYCRPEEAEDKCQEYAELLKKFPPDIIFLGVGENGHIAFNDPQVADFNDPKDVKIVELDQVCRNQQVNDGCFESIDQVPTHALTLTLSLIMRVPQAITVVPTSLKARAVARALHGEISEECPASILRRHASAELYLDRESAREAFNL